MNKTFNISYTSKYYKDHKMTISISADTEKNALKEALARITPVETKEPMLLSDLSVLSIDILMIDLDKKYVTRSGLEVILSAIDTNLVHSIKGTVKTEDRGAWGHLKSKQCTWTNLGLIEANTKSPFDLVEVS
jgi:hypothetical protein